MGIECKADMPHGAKTGTSETAALDSPRLRVASSRKLATLGWVGLLFFSFTASANAGTPLLWVSLFHLALGNFFLGLLEGALIAKFFHIPTGRTIRWMILANYLSAFAALVGMDRFHDRWAQLETARGFFVLEVVLAYVMTLLLEWPFVLWAFRGTPAWLSKSLRASLAVQTISYVLLFGVYAPFSNISLLTQWRVVSPDRLAVPEDVAIFYIAKADGGVYRMGKEPAEDVKIGGSPGKLDESAWLELGDSTTDSNAWALLGVNWANQTVILDRLLPRPAFDSFQAAATRQRFFGTHKHGYHVGKAAEDPWELIWFSWPEVGVRWQRRNERVRLGWGTPLGGWMVRRVIGLPEDHFLIVLGDQICLAGLSKREITVLRRGWDALAFLKEQLDKSTLPTPEPPAAEPTP